MLSWGAGRTGQLGNGGHTDETVLTIVTDLTNIKDIAAGGRHAQGIDACGRPPPRPWLWSSTS
ncbi:RCC1 domain-containing protein [Streptomyces sp. A1547]|uniref:RCC1 domain-containing protein n=1 Tax=Streptomyces sp. A1547 TaxID=2563105 RepID=UPI001F109B26|nr:RCC1 domain-containing protein [Streptomyces sp. A1547]